MLEKIKDKEIDPDQILMMDKAHFYLTGRVNKHNYCYWAPENPKAIEEKPLHDE